MFTYLMTIIDYCLFASCLFLLVGSIYISYKTNFVQIRLFPSLIKMFIQSMMTKKNKEDDKILPHIALLTAMSTTIGIGTIAGPVIAIHLGGPGALLGFLFTSILGSAATFTEVSLCVEHRNKLASGNIIGGPMAYLKKLISPVAATWYAVCCCILMTAWSAAQANQLAAIFNSPLLGEYSVSPVVSGGIVACLVLFSLFGGIKRVSSLSAKMVPMMFVMFLGASFWILFANIDKLPHVFMMIVQSAFSPYALASGSLVGGIVSALRWGIFKGTQATEAGVGTQTIPHSLTTSNDGISQGALSMISTYTAGGIAFLSGCVVLVTDTWQDPQLPMGISMIAASFQMYFSSIGVAIIAFCTFLFGFGTCLGNSYNGSQCFLYFVNEKYVRYYFLICACLIFFGAVAEAKMLWSVIDIFLAAIVVPNMFALMRHVSGYVMKDADSNQTLVINN